MEVAIGVDPSKSSLAVAAVDPLGRVVGTAEFSNDPRGHRALLGWVGERGPDRVIGIECSLSYGATLSRVLLRSGEDVREVPTTLTHRQRRRRASQGKSDMVDSVAITRIEASGEVLPSAHRLEVLADLRAQVEYRDQLVRARTQVANRTHADLVNVLPGYERQVPNLRAKAHRTTARSLLRGDRSARSKSGSIRTWSRSARGRPLLYWTVGPSTVRVFPQTQLLDSLARFIFAPREVGCWAKPRRRGRAWGSIVRSGRPRKERGGLVVERPFVRRGAWAHSSGRSPWCDRSISRRSLGRQNHPETPHHP